MVTNKLQKYTGIALIPIIIFTFVLIFTAQIFTINQRIILGSLFVVVYWWATVAINRTLAAALLLGSFIVFGQTDLESIFNFPLSPTFVLIFCSFLLAQGITNVHIAEHIADLVLQRWGNSPWRLMLMAFVLGILMIFLIPHPFPRVIMLGLIFNTFLERQHIAQYPRGIMMMSVYIAGTTTPMLFLNGDFILNYGAMQFADMNVTWLEWARYMTLPALITCAISLAVLLAVFRKELATIQWQSAPIDLSVKKKLTFNQRVAYLIMITAMVLWATESLHGISAAVVALGGVVMMFGSRLIHFSDLRKVNYQLLLYLTAVFAIGRVFNSSGISLVLGEYLKQYVGSGSLMLLYTLIIGITMLIHLLLGSCMTTMSITIPIFTALLGTVINPIAIALISYITVSINYILPFHHLTLILGIGEGYFTNQHLRRYGIPMTLLVFVIVLGIFLPYWNLIGLL